MKNLENDFSMRAIPKGIKSIDSNNVIQTGVSNPKTNSNLFLSPGRLREIMCPSLIRSIGRLEVKLVIYSLGINSTLDRVVGYNVISHLPLKITPHKSSALFRSLILLSLVKNYLLFNVCFNSIVQ